MKKLSLLHAWRGVVLDNGQIVAWPALLLDHNEAFNKVRTLSNYRCRWRQWDGGMPVDFDSGASQEDKDAVEAWIAAANAVSDADA